MHRALARGGVAIATVAAMGMMGLPAHADHSTTPPADYGSAGDPTITLPINDSHAGGTYYQPFERAFAGETEDGTPVYIYVPTGAIGGAEGVHSMDPAFDHNPDDEFVPCADNPASDFLITQAQIDYLGSELESQIVAVDEAHFGPMDAADPADPASDSLVTVIYNVQDESYYDCAVTTYTAGYFAPDFIDSVGMNTIVIDAFDWVNRVGTDEEPGLYEGVIAHELEHLLMNYSDSGELSWVDEGLADFAGFVNGYDVTGSHLTYQQVFHNETSLTRWGGGLENYGASYTYFQYLWEQAGGNGDGTFEPDQEYDNTAGDLLIKKVFEEQADDMEGVQKAIDAYNAQTGSDLRSAATLFKDWAVAVYLDDEDSELFDIKAVDLGPDSGGWTIDVANDEFWDDRGNYTGRQPGAKWDKLDNQPARSALPFGVSYEKFRNPGPNVTLELDGADSARVAPHTGETHYWGGYASQSDTVLNVAATGGQTLGFWNWHFIEEGWDYGFVEALVGGEWVTVPVTDDAGNTVTSDDDPHGNNTEGNGITGTSGGAYFVDEPEYVHYNAVLPAGTTQARFRYSTDAAYLDTGWFIDDVTVAGAPAVVTPAAEDGFVVTTGEQDNNWTGQVVSACDLTPGVDTAGEITDGAGNFVYRFEGDDISSYALNTKCGASKNTVAVVISNLPTGDLRVLDAPYDVRLVGTGKG